MHILAVNYHYVHSGVGHPFNRLHALSVESFGRQLDALDRAGEYVAPDRLERILNGEERPEASRGFTLTFDDGLKDHAHFVAPELAKRGWSAFFFVNTAPWLGELLSVHRLQLLTATVPVDDLLAAFNRVVDDNGIEFDIDDPAVSIASIQSQYRYDDPQVAKLKYAMNVRLQTGERDQVAEGLFHRFMGPDGQFVGDLYMTAEECRSLSEDGHTIGCHSHRHHALSKMDALDRDTDLSNNIQLITSLGQGRPSWVSYPYGSEDAYDEGVKASCRALGLGFAFTMTRGAITQDADHLALNRVDTNDAPGGKSPTVLWMGGSRAHRGHNGE